MRSKAFALATIVAVGVLLGLAPSAVADQPLTTMTTFDRTKTYPAGRFCPFAFTAHTEGTIRETVYSSGKDAQHAVDFHITYTNLVNGRAATTVLAGPFVVEPNGDGTVTVTINGNDGHITAPGQGTIFADVGKFVYIADPNDVYTPLAILKSTGRQDASQFPATCDALS